MGEIMNEGLKIYMRSNSKIYVCVNEEIFYYENEELASVLEMLKEEYEFEEEKMSLSIILHFSYFLLDDKKIETEKNKFDENMEEIQNIDNIEKGKIDKNFYGKEFLDDFVEKNINSVNKRFYLNHMENRYINIYLRKKKIAELVKVSKKFGFEVEKIKADFISVYNFYKHENVEILQIGEEKSLRFTIENNGITDIEKIELTINDVHDIDNFDFGNMETLAVDKGDIKNIFYGSELYDEPNFRAKSEIINMESIRNIGVKDMIIIVFLVFGYFLLSSMIPLEKEIKRNEKIRQETKKLEKEYLNKKNDKIPDYSEELTTLNEIDSTLKRKEYFSVIKFLIDNSEYGLDYTKISYKNKKWTIQGEMPDFNNFEKFENNITNKYEKTELGYIKDNDTATVFEYNILE